jgi:Ca2+-transporting ATPase
LFNRKLVLVVALSFGLQVWSQHNATLGRFLKSTSLSFADCFALLLLGAIPLAALEAIKVMRHALSPRLPPKVSIF